MAEGKIAGLYDLERTLGKGHFAVVKLARHVFTGQRVAVKVIDKSKLAGEAAGQLLQEVRCMKLVQHPNVVRLYEVIDTHAKLYLILELGDGGDMFDHIMRHEGGLAEPRAKHYFAQIVHAISYCHKLHVVHRDLKPENVVFFQEQGLVKLTDFGFSNRFQPGKMLTTSCGSLAYSAPEILLGDEYDAPAVDIWSLGVILYMLVCGQPPFQEANDSETLTMIMDCRYTVPPHVSAQCSDLISRMLQRDPRQRASLEQIESHAWLQGVDPSPASRCLLPLTSHKRVSQEEHEIIIQAMTCGHIADRETIQEALEADRYNHITATYFLLAERMLREKQEEQGRRQSLLYDLAKQVQSRTGLPDTLGPGDGAGSRQPLAEAPGSSQRPSLPDGGDGGRCRQPARVLLKAPTIDTTITKSTPALQQICEEEEEEEEEECRPGVMERKSSSLNQEQMRDFLRSGARRPPCRGEK
ncbi:SNF-related serine/threonine-protein kinase-like isoform X2 [Numida meleagris]|uniref:SNF-related serine/threonine-protein kinase-like isoform X2 n=1 Tax=Numida meleagris TaxID=8996 RepID=UPI000B3D8AAB|nr:SNF-related serine/threonine-protein kinase-like isoform X2 [Numida meleagris]